MLFRYITEVIKRNRLNVNVSLIATINVIDLDEDHSTKK